jgi:hypothetical protein
MTTTHTWTGPLLALGLAVSGTLTAAAGGTAYGGTVASCTIPVLNVHKGRLEGAAGSRYQTVRVVNEGDQPCSVPGFPRYRFRDEDRPIGFRSTRTGTGSGPVVIGAGEAARSVLSWVDPGPVPRNQCHPHRATGFAVKIRHLPGHFELPLRARVCTTEQYRPHASHLTS